MDRTLLEDMVRVADQLDRDGLHREASVVDGIMTRVAQVSGEGFNKSATDYSKRPGFNPDINNAIWDHSLGIFGRYGHYGKEYQAAKQKLLSGIGLGQQQAKLPAGVTRATPVPGGGTRYTTPTGDVVVDSKGKILYDFRKVKGTAGVKGKNPKERTFIDAAQDLGSQIKSEHQSKK